MSKKKYNNDIYRMYEEEFDKRVCADKEIKLLKLEISNLKSDLKNALNRNKRILEKTQSEIDKEVSKAVKPYIAKIDDLNNNLTNALKEIDRLKNIKKEKNDVQMNYLIDKLNNQINKDSTNSSIPTSKESIKNSIKRRTNTYNHRISSGKKTGAQFDHIGKTLTKKKLEKIIEENNLEVKEIKHYIDNKKYNNIIEKYKVGLEIKTYIEKHVFIPSNKTKEILPKEFYSNVTYCTDLKSLITILGNYCFLPYNKIKELISNLSNNVINLSDGTIDNIYNEFSNKSEETILNITNNLLNGTYQHTDETVTSENGIDSYYRGYANKENVLYKYHNHKGDKPIEEDGILSNFYGALITDHDVGMFKYGINNQDCIIHFGRYCIEQNQNITTTCWQIRLYNLLLKFERNRHILMKYKVNKFNEEEIKLMEKEYDDILEIANEENKLISSTYWKEKANTLLKRCIKYKKQMLLYIHDFNVCYDNNFIERALRMIKSKTKVSGGFRSHNGGVRFGRIMSVIKTSKLRGINPFSSIMKIMKGISLFA